jgi:hypothetical protein
MTVGTVKRHDPDRLDGVDVITRASAWTRRKGGELVVRSASPALVEQLELARRAEAHRRHPSAAGD